MNYDTRPDDLASWFITLPAAHRQFLREHDLLIPFVYFRGLGPFIEAAKANECIQCHMAELPEVWTEEAVERAPEMRWEFDIVVAFGSWEVLSWAGVKGWGNLLWVGPLLPGDPIDGIFLNCVHKPSSPYRQKLEQRRWLRKKLGSFSGLVSHAMRARSSRKFIDLLTSTSRRRSKQSQLIARPLPLFPGDPVPVVERNLGQVPLLYRDGADPVAVIREKLGMSPEQFVKVACGREMLPPARFIDKQRELFPEEVSS